MIPNNPFLISGYHSPEYFCDRKQETAKITDGLHNGRNITLIAPRRMGKTGLIRHTFQNINNQDSKIITLYMDIFSTQSLGDFVKLFANTVLGKLDSNPKKALNRITRFIRSCRPIFTIDELTGIPKVTIDVVPSEEENTLKEIFDYLSSSEKRCYIAIDEFQQIAKYPEKNIEALLRTHIQKSGNSNFIFAGSERHMMQEMFTSAARPFYNSTDILELNAIPAEIYTKFVVYHFERRNKRISQNDVMVLYDLFKGHTYYMQRTFNEAFADTPEGETCTKEIIDNAVNTMIDSSDTIFREILSNIPENQKSVLYAIAKDGEATQIHSSDFISRHKLKSASSVQAAVKRLLDRDIITEINKVYSVNDKLFAMWINKINSNI